MAALDLYRAKRDFKRTPEPSGARRAARAKAQAGGIFVIHKHAARRLHYDLRLEHKGVLWSWAVTKGPSLDPAEKRLAVHVEDHPLDYGSFEGNIPKDEYGAGAVIVWDEGHWLPEGDPEYGMKKGHLAFALKGQKLNGVWHLVRLKPRRGEKRDNWLLIKSDDEFADDRFDILGERPESVKTGLSIEQVAAGDTGQSQPKPAKAAPTKATATASAAPEPRTPARKAPPKARAKDERSGPPPAFVAPCLATLRAKPPAGDGWLHEVKFDGYRVQARITGGKVRLLARSGLDWTAKFGDAIPADLLRLPCDNALVDGEIVVLRGGGISSFSALQAALSDGRTEQLVYFMFDLLHLDGQDLRHDPLLARRERLDALLAEAGALDALRFSEHFIEPGDVMLAHSCRLGLEGVISKRMDAPYRSGRGHDWIKSKCTQRQEFVIAGYVPSRGSGYGLGSLVVGYLKDGALVPAGRVGTGFTQRAATELKKRLDAIKSTRSPYEGAAGREKGIVWVKPELVAEIEFRAWTDGGSIRHASYQGLREDKPADEVVAETPEPEETATPAPERGAKKPSRGKAAAASTKPPKTPKTSIKLSNPAKVLWPDTGLTKAGLLDYYATVWPLMEPFVVDRPLSLVRAPDGIDGQRFFQKHGSPGMPDAIRTIRDPKDGEDILYISDFDGLAALVQLGTLEIHGWGSTIADLERPDHMVFDLDPDPGVPAARVQEAAIAVRDRLAELSLKSVVKTSGGKGYHVVVPLKPKADWAAVKGFAHNFARAMAQAEPDRYTATLSKKARKGRIFIDYLRNGRGSTAIVAYSTRARPGAPVSMPIGWADLARSAPDAFNVGNCPDKPAQHAEWRTWRDKAPPLRFK